MSHSLQLPAGTFRCPDQKLRAQTYPISNMTDITPQHEQVILESASIINSTYTITIARKQRYVVNFSILGNGQATVNYPMPLVFSELSIVPTVACSDVTQNNCFAVD